MVSLVFVLNADGSVQNASIAQAETHASNPLQNYSLNCLQAAAPFGSFPKELSASQIAFTVTVYFDEI